MKQIKKNNHGLIIVIVFAVVLLIVLFNYSTNLKESNQYLLESNNQLNNQLEEEKDKRHYDFSWNCQEILTCGDGRVFTLDLNDTWDISTHSVYQSNIMGLFPDPLFWNEETGQYSRCVSKIQDCKIVNVSEIKKFPEAHKGVKQ